jgi:hypothetical protein
MLNPIPFVHPAIPFRSLGPFISSTLKMEAICSSETSVATQQTTRRHIPEDNTLPLLLLFYLVVYVASFVNN